MTTKELTTMLDGQQKQITEITKILATIATELHSNTEMIGTNSKLLAKVCEAIKIINDNQHKVF
tara:strand:+ start:1972 stop:2163 length:192 start_codon:yes stop_codon:yes gene_type:complete